MSFIANELFNSLMSKKVVPHTAAHDLDSIFYVMLHIFMTFQGPGSSPAHINNGHNEKTSIWSYWCEGDVTDQAVSDSGNTTFTGNIDKFIWTKFHRTLRTWLSHEEDI